MRRANELRRRLLGGVLAFALAIGIFAAGFCGTPLTGHAAGQAKVTASTGAKIRESADTASTMVGGAEKDKVLTVLGQTQGADGYTWYQVQVNDTTTGYVRSDLVEVSGDIPAGGTEGGEGEGGGESAPPVEVTQVNPVSASVSGEGVEIRDTASLSGQVLGTVPDATAITVTGYVTDADNVNWYQVNCILGETQIDGFLLSDNCALSADLTPLGQESPETPEEPEPTVAPEPNPYELVEKNGRWLIVDTVNDPGNGYPVDQLFENVDKNAQLYRDSEAKVKDQKIVIIVLVFLLVAAVAGIAFLVFKIRDMTDSAYFSEVENETLRRKKASGGEDGQGGQSRQKPAMHTVGPKEQQPRAAGARPAGSGQRPAGASGQRSAAPAGQRSAADSAQGQRPASRSSAQRPVQGARPAGAPQGQGVRSAGAVQGTRAAGTQGSRPAPTAGQRIAGGDQRSAGSGQRPAGVQGQRPVGTQGARRPEGASGRAPQGARPGQASQKAQPKNFMADDDEFEFEYLNYDGDDE
ncbi:MAG: SH3 domain-containing protein [Lachnospiraceae bacterium]|nr:SH3 domain-containing protein [uncultured Acetatifactor sp.]MCI9229984.1 SH3 domain-containing protein [Lachnospiraceae bacterium]